jgi:hypothetical protein
MNQRVCWCKKLVLAKQKLHTRKKTNSCGIAARKMFGLGERTEQSTST